MKQSLEDVAKRQAEEMAHTCSGGLLKAGETDMLDTKPDPDKMSFRMPLIPRRSRDFAPNGEPFAHVERSRINPCVQVRSYCSSSHKILNQNLSLTLPCMLKC